MPFEKGVTPEGATPFQPGQSGNPSGKKPGTKNRTTTVRELLELARGLPDHLKSEFPEFEKVTYEELITLAQLNRAADGDTIAYKAVMDSAYGAPKQATEHTGPDGGPIKTQNTVVGQWTIIDATNGQIPPPIDV
ncbi:DUF5681 domain-containing protein [Spirosoma luteum]|uniref:DUF5681 domain-containing protein n=1 Tax=Spirosoma luteum TaxID=431553 RepID=UPI00037BC1D1|nr:DUF5681 domain-containing protein [Spirosoma luteum]